MTRYHHGHDLTRFAKTGEEAPELWRKFNALYDTAFGEGPVLDITGGAPELHPLSGTSLGGRVRSVGTAGGGSSRGGATT